MPDAIDPERKHVPKMLTTDLALRVDPEFEAISRRFKDDPDQLQDAFARAWFKLTHRDMGPRARYLGPEVPDEVLIWQDPVPAPSGEPIGADEIATLKERILASGLPVSRLVSAAWASASTFRGGDKRGGANGARVRLEPQKAWDVNDPSELAQVLTVLEQIQADFDGDALARRPDRAGRLRGGRAGGEGRRPGRRGPVHPGPDRRLPGGDRGRVLRIPRAGRRRFPQLPGGGARLPAEYLLVDRANLLTLTAPEMTVLVGGLRVLGANSGGSSAGVLTDRPETLTNDFFVNLLSMDTVWKPTSSESTSFEARDGAGEVKWTGSRVDLVFGSNSELRALAEVYARADAGEKFARDFVAAWAKVMDLDRFELS